MSNFKKQILKILNHFLMHYDQMWAYHENKHCTRNNHYSDYAEYMWLACNHIRRKIKKTEIEINDWNDIYQILNEAYDHFSNLVNCDKAAGRKDLEKAHTNWCKSLTALKGRL